MLGKYSLEAVKGIAPERTKKVVETIEKAGGKVHSMYALLGCQDLAMVVDFSSNSEAIKASLTITKLTGIGFNTSPAVSIEDFDKIVG